MRELLLREEHLVNVWGQLGEQEHGRDPGNRRGRGRSLGLAHTFRKRFLKYLSTFLQCVLAGDLVAVWYGQPFLQSWENVPLLKQMPFPRCPLGLAGSVHCGISLVMGFSVSYHFEDTDRTLYF